MRTHGTLIKWNDERGFGFISCAGGKQEIFVHISAFPRGKRPQLNELISFETEVTADGKRRAVRIMRPAQAAKPVSRTNSWSNPRRRFGTGGIAAALIVSLGFYGYERYRATPDLPRAQSIKRSPVASSVEKFRCDGRTMCSQMTSCEEATFFIQNCPNTKMDGNNDGQPCESQWCK